MEHPQLAAVGLFETHEHASEGAIRMVRPATKFAATPASIRSLAPRHGEHSEEILREAGYGADEIAALIDKNIVFGKG
jgi:formyl-CoA transferase